MLVDWLIICNLNDKFIEKMKTPLCGIFKNLSRFMCIMYDLLLFSDVNDS